jgi:hypothetical protein
MKNSFFHRQKANFHQLLADGSCLLSCSGASKFGKGVKPTDGDTYDKEIYLSEHDLSKFASSMNEIS